MRMMPLAMLLLVVPVAARAGCKVDGQPVAFGTIDLDRRAIGTGQIVVACDEATGFEISLAGGFGSGGLREMRGPNDGRLRYQLFRDSARSMSWGDGSHGDGGTSSGRSNGSDAVKLTIYGAVPAQGAVPARRLHRPAPARRHLLTVSPVATPLAAWAMAGIRPHKRIIEVFRLSWPQAPPERGCLERHRCHQERARLGAVPSFAPPSPPAPP